MNTIVLWIISSALFFLVGFGVGIEAEEEFEKKEKEKEQQEKLVASLELLLEKLKNERISTKKE